MTDTICSISTAAGVGAISIIRVSGPESINTVNKVFSGIDLCQAKSHTIHYGKIIDNNEEIDEVLISIMRAPKTFTTEDIAEINCHGGIATTNKVLELLLLNGCRLAEAGEFTKRAFLNNRIDLLEAEAVMDLINASSEKERTLAMNQVGGRITTIVENIRKKLLSIQASIEVNIDYPEYEDIEEVTNEIIAPKLKEIRMDLNNLLEETKNGQLIKNGIKIALVGRPNVGKSSILNALLNEEKAIVTEVAGTTRDIVEGSIVLKGIKINFIDTAGIRDTDDIVEQIGVKRSKEVISTSDLVILILNNNESITSEDFELLNLVDKYNHLVFINKNDLPKSLNIEGNNYVYGNTINMYGLSSLKEEIIKRFNLDEIESSDPTYLSNVRHIFLVKEAMAYLDNALLQINQGMPTDVVEIDIVNCWKSLGEITGKVYKDELIDELFSQFCLGK